MTSFVLVMDYQTFIQQFSKVKDLSLPGKQAHLLTAPLHRIDGLNQLEQDYTNAKKAAVLLYCYPKNDRMHLALIKRTAYDGPHSGQISFPGGKPERTDRDLFETALRECNEELGVRLVHSKPSLSLSPLYIPPSNFLVNPYVVIDSEEPHFRPDAREVDFQIEIAIGDLMNLKVKQKPLNYQPFNGYQVPCYHYRNHIIWGATAMILSEFKFFLGKYRLK
ncbi:MAG: CoA pyrophosphatase [Flavobacteriaceae bacterium]